MLQERDIWRLTRLVNADIKKYNKENHKRLNLIQEDSGDHGYPSTPHHFNCEGKAVFTSRQLEWGLPEHFGWDEEYEVQDLGPSYALNWSDEFAMRRRPVHHYSRIDRFKFTLAQLLGCAGEVPKTILHLMPTNLKYVSREDVWVTVRQILKTNNLRLYYNRIPAILAGLGLISFKNIGDKFNMIMKDFERMHHVFRAIKKQVNREYFPNLRYVAVRLIKKHAIELPYVIPPTLTVIKTRQLDIDFDKIWGFIFERDCDEFTAEMEQFFTK
jgi:hypothetical protein